MCVYDLADKIDEAKTKTSLYDFLAGYSSLPNKGFEAGTGFVMNL